MSDLGMKLEQNPHLFPSNTLELSSVSLVQLFAEVQRLPFLLLANCNAMKKLHANPFVS